MLHIVESRKPLDRVAKDLEAAVGRHKFGVLGVHDLRAKMAEKGVAFDRSLRDSGSQGRGARGGSHAGGEHGRGGEGLSRQGGA